MDIGEGLGLVDLQTLDGECKPLEECVLYVHVHTDSHGMHHANPGQKGTGSTRSSDGDPECTAPELHAPTLAVNVSSTDTHLLSALPLERHVEVSAICGDRSRERRSRGRRCHGCVHFNTGSKHDHQGRVRQVSLLLSRDKSGEEKTGAQGKEDVGMGRALVGGSLIVLFQTAVVAVGACSTHQLQRHRQ